MGKIKNFIYVTSQRSDCLHVLPSGRRVEGEKTACGRQVNINWHWFQRARERNQKPVCRQCKKAS